jgi:NAD-dependent SIR2 family protein deacetylase
MTRQAPDRNVYVLGAGFSRSSGAPLVRDFLDRARQFLQDPTSQLDETERGQFRSVFDFRREMAQSREKVRIDLDDIEQLFGLVEISQQLGKTKGETRDDTVYLIAKTLQLATAADYSKRPRLGYQLQPFAFQRFSPNLLTVFRNTSSRDFTADIYHHFAGLLVGLFDNPDRALQRQDTIITFNYDIVVDQALRQVGFEAAYHIDEKMLGVPRPGNHRKACSVLKLHGSANWGICTNCRESVVILEEEKVTDSPNEFRARRCGKCSKQSFHPLLIPPSWDKSEYREIMKPVWTQAIAELSSATRICIIGYSMPEVDASFKYLLALALSQNHELFRFIVVDFVEREDVQNGVEARYRELLEPLFQKRRFSFYSQGFESFLSNRGAYEELGRGEGIGDNIRSNPR